ncbi:hypothetical protein AB0E96_40380, partial [Kitasatospora sp. NPDC036755]
EILEAAERIDQVSPLLEDLVTQADDLRFRRVLVDAVGEGVYHRAVEELDGKPWNSVVRLARTVEQHGFDAEEMLARVARSRSFGDADCASKALHYRLKGALATAEKARATADQAAVRRAEAAEQAQEQQLMQAQAQSEQWWLPKAEAESVLAESVWDEGEWDMPEPELEGPIVAEARQAGPTDPFARPLQDATPAQPGQWWKELRLADEETADAGAGAQVSGESDWWSQPVDRVLDQADAQALDQVLQMQQAVSLGLSPELTTEELTAAQIGVVGTQFYDPQAQVRLAAEMQVLQDAHEAQAAQLQHEQDWMTQVMATQMATTLQAGQVDQLRYDTATERAEAAAERATWNWRLRHVEGEVGEYAHGLLSEIVEPRERALAEQLAAAEELPEWASTTLGPVPDADDPAREEWLQRASDVMQYREAHGYDHEKLAIGPAPAEGAVEVRASWSRAWRALGEPEDRRDLVGATDRDLRELVDRYRREELWAPAHVADQMQVTYESQQDLLREAAQMRIRAGELEESDPQQAAELRDEAETYAQIAAEAAERATKLEIVHDARQGWYEETTEARERAEQAAAELEKRGVPVDEVDQPGLEWPEDWPESDLESEWDAGAWDMAEPEAELDPVEAEAAVPAVEAEPSAEVEQAEPFVEQPVAEAVEEAQPAVAEVEPQGVPQAPATVPGDVEPAPVERPAAEVEQPSAELVSEPDPEFQPYRWATGQPVAGTPAVDEGEWDMPEPEDLPDLPEPAPVVDTFAQEEEARRVELQRSALEQEMQRQEQVAASTRAVSGREPSAPQQALPQQSSDRERQDQELAQARVDIRDVAEARRNAIEVQELEGPALDDAVGVALAAKDILAER